MKWLHLSDIHFADFGFSIKKMRSALMDKLRAMSLNLDFIIITGDCFYQNDSSKTIVPDLKRFITEIRRECKVDKSCVFICQGNHDLNREDSDRNKIVEEARAEPMLSTATYTSLTGIGNDNFRSLYREVLNKEYEDFSVFEPKKLGVRIVSINSCLLSKDNNDYQNLRVCAPVLEEIGKSITAKDDDKLNLVIMHHGIDWLHPKDARSFEHWAEDTRIDAVFVGHTHQPNVAGLHDVNRDIYQFTSGALVLDGYAIPSFFICEEDHGLLTVSLFSYSDSTDSWELDNRNLRKFKDDGKHSFILPRRLVATTIVDDSIGDLTCDEIINTLNTRYETKYGSKRFVSDKTKEYEDFNAWKIFGSLVNIGVYYPVALRLCVSVVESVTSPDYPAVEILHSSTIKEVINNHLINANKLYPELNEFEIGIWASTYARHYDKGRGFVLVDGDREDPISYNLLKTAIIKDSVLQITGNEVYYKKLPTSELEKMSYEIMRFIKSLGISRIERNTLLSIVKEYVSEPPHPWFVNNNRPAMLEYHKQNADKHLRELVADTESNPILQIEAAYHLFACFLTIYDDFIGCTETSPITILKNSVDHIDLRRNDRLPMRRCLLVQLRDDLREKGIRFEDFRACIDKIFTNIVENRKVTNRDTVTELVTLRRMLSQIEHQTEEDWKDTGITFDDIRAIFKNAQGFIVREPIQYFSRKAFFFSPYWDDHQAEQLGLGDDILVILKEAHTMETLCKYLSQKRKKSITEIVLFKDKAESFSSNERKFIRDELRKYKINVRCIFIQKSDFTYIRTRGWRKEFYRVLGISRMSMW